MDRDRVLTVPLLGFLLTVLLALGYAAVDCLLPRSFDAMLSALRDADLEGEERREILRALVALGASAPDRASDRRQQLCALTAAVALDDEAAFRAAAPDASAPPFRADDIALFEVASVGDEVVAGLLAAVAAELRGDGDEARRRFEQVAASSRLFHLRLGAKLCAEGLARLQ